MNHYRTLIHTRNAYPALQIGTMLQLPSANRGVYAFLRYIEGQTFLVLINLTRNPIEDYRFCLNSGNLQVGTATEILFNSWVNAPTLNATGGFDDYRAAH